MIKGKISREHIGEIVILAVSESEEVFREMSECLREAWFDGEMMALYSALLSCPKEQEF